MPSAAAEVPVQRRLVYEPRPAKHILDRPETFALLLRAASALWVHSAAEESRRLQRFKLKTERTGDEYNRTTGLASGVAEGLVQLAEAVAQHLV